MSRHLQIEVRDSLGDVTPADWNALNLDGNPFLFHEFLHALDSTGCLGKSTGWFPRYFLLWSAPTEPRELIGAVPTYVKTNSYGEFVFDWAWAEAYERHNLPYYPKLVSSIPFTPATGRRLLVRDNQDESATIRLLAAAVRQFCDSQGYSGLHWLFVTELESRLLCDEKPKPMARKSQRRTGDTRTDSQTDDTDDADEDDTPTASNDLLDAGDHLARIDCQYHWHNREYTSFDHFLAQCTAKRRKTIRRERRFVSDAGLRLERRLGDTLSDQEWCWVHRFYESTFDRKWGNPSLTLDFFRSVGQTLGDRVLIVFAYDEQDETPEWPVACSIMFRGDSTLYGRFWGCRAQFHSLHFEACYYQGIEYCIEQGIANFEPGAQGEHKITRGFEPTITHSAHYIAHSGFREAIADFLEEETQYMQQRCSGLTNLLPFKHDPVQLSLDADPVPIAR